MLTGSFLEVKRPKLGVKPSTPI